MGTGSSSRRLVVGLGLGIPFRTGDVDRAPRHGRTLELAPLDPANASFLPYRHVLGSPGAFGGEQRAAPAGLVLAAESVGNRRMLVHSRALAESLQRGEPLAGRTQDMAGIPPFLYWLMATGQDHGGLLPALRHSADTYRRRARFQADAARLILPVALTVVLGGGITFLYALMVFGSWILLIRSLAGI